MNKKALFSTLMYVTFWVFALIGHITFSYLTSTVPDPEHSPSEIFLLMFIFVLPVIYGLIGLAGLIICSLVDAIIKMIINHYEKKCEEY